MPKPPPPPKPPRPPKPKAPKRSALDPFARALAQNVRDAHGVDQASTLDMSEELGRPRGYVGTRNIALERALGTTGIPLGRFVEVSGWPGAGKSTILDQVFAQAQQEGGIAVLADTERGRDRKYMVNLGVRPESMVWIGGSTVESMFDEVETLVRTAASMSARAWVAALKRAGVKCSDPPTYKHEVFDPATKKQKNRRPIKVFTFAKWGREQAAVLLAWQKANGLHPSSVRDAPSRAALRPCVVYSDDPAEIKEAMTAWSDGEDHHLVQPADRPIVIGWDSVAGTPTEAELAGDARDQHVASAAKAIRRNLRRMVQLIDDEAIAFVLVNQRYEMIKTGGGFGTSNYKPSETYGGGGIKYHTTIRIEVDKVGDIFQRADDRKNNVPPLGQIVRIKVPKNKVADPFHKEEFGLVFGRGADNAWAVFNDLKARGIIRHASWSRFTDPTILGVNDKAWQGGWMGLSNLIAETSGLWERLKGIYMEGRA
ncbi:MAG: hypothetical protein CMB99_01105 [Flavobacteriaceae bacterium]|nr:hypothetical protein [Flavobacteriaceae bacterium]